MNLGEPILKAVIEFLQDDGCPLCGEHPTTLDLNGPNEIVLKYGHIVDARPWIKESADLE